MNRMDSNEERPLPGFYQNAVRGYYNGFSRHLLSDYVNGNKRLQFAVRHALQWVPAEAKAILDVGCGIGWSSWTLKRHHMRSAVIGLDLGPHSIAIAKRLFEEEGLRFLCLDFTEDCVLADHSFDVITCLDVYEHFRQLDRPRIHHTIDRLLTESGTLFLSYPSFSAMLRTYSERPELLQPVDELVAAEDIARLAGDIHGRIVFNKEVGIFASDDYMYTAISRSRKGQFPMPVPGNEKCFESLPVRSCRVQDRLNIRVTSSGTMLPVSDGPAICLMLSESFTNRQILRRTFIEALPEPVRILSGAPVHPECDDGTPLLPEYGVLERLHHAIRRRTAKCQVDPALEDPFTDFILQNRITRVVSDSLAGASALLPLCQKRGLPLSVWFPGPNEAIPDMSVLDATPELSERIKAFVSGSERVSQRLSELGVPADRIHPIPYGIDAHLFAGAHPEKSAPLLVSVHDSLRTDEPELVLLAFREVVLAYPEARLLMTGNPCLPRRGARLAEWLGIGHAVDLRSSLAETDLADVLRRTRAVICLQQLPLVTRESLVQGVMAAMSAGVPVIATHSTAMAELVGNNAGALIQDPGPDDVAREMCGIIDDPLKAGKMGAVARQIVDGKYRLDENVARFLAALG